MSRKFPVITLCGSTRFKDEFERVQKDLTLKGNIVISVGLFGHSGDDEVWEGMSEDTLTETKRMLDEMHKRKIDLAQSIFVINPEGYIGDSTWSEICYARMSGKEIQSLEPIDMDEVDSRVADRIESAELLAWQSQDALIHVGAYAYQDGEPSCITYKGQKIYDPWALEDREYTDEPMGNHGGEAMRMQPFEKYGKEKMAAFVEGILEEREK